MCVVPKPKEMLSGRGHRAFNDGGTVHMSLYEMTVEPIAHPHGAFDVDAVVDSPGAQRAFFECFPNDVKFECGLVDAANGQADAANADAFAGLAQAGHRADTDAQSLAFGRRRDTVDRSHLFHNARKHD